jgi:hypothetical protein
MAPSPEMKEMYPEDFAWLQTICYFPPTSPKYEHKKPDKSQVYESVLDEEFEKWND